MEVQPLRVVCDSRLSSPPNMLCGGKGGVIACVRPADETRKSFHMDCGTMVLELGADKKGRVELRDLVSELYDLGMRTILLECGPKLGESFSVSVS